MDYFKFIFILEIADWWFKRNKNQDSYNLQQHLEMMAQELEMITQERNNAIKIIRKQNFFY